VRSGFPDARAMISGKIDAFPGVWASQFIATDGLAKCQKPFCECSPFYALGGILRHLAS